MPPKAKTASDPEEDDYINVVFKDDDFTGLPPFRIKKTTKMRKLMTAYYRHTGLQLHSKRFFLDGKRIGDNDTPTGLDMVEDGEGGNVVEVFPETFGA